MKNNQLEQQLLLATLRDSQSELDDETRSLHQAYGNFAELLEASTEEIDTESLVDQVLAASSCRPLRRSSWRGSKTALLATAASFLLLVSLANQQWDADRDVPLSATPPSVAVHKAPSLKSPVNETATQAWNDDWDARLEQAENLATAIRWSAFTRLEAAQWSAREARREVEKEWQGGSL